MILERGIECSTKSLNTFQTYRKSLRGLVSCALGQRW
nr:MAG TPA: hypothetical protein [Caudoviricetes sp.]